MNRFMLPVAAQEGEEEQDTKIGYLLSSQEAFDTSAPVLIGR